MATFITGTYSNNESVAYQVLTSNGFNLAQVCGILANIYEESKFNQEAYNSLEGAYGLCQWRLNRKENMYKLYGNPTSVKNQVQFIIDELNSSESKAYTYIKDLPNSEAGAGQTGYYFASKYERCHSSHYETRRARAIEYWRFYNNGNKPDITPSTDLSHTPKEVPSTTDTVDSLGYPAYQSLSSIDPYANIIKENLSRVTAAGFDYGYLIDMTYGGEFKFYIPEFSESAGANWGDVDIPGRSVTIKSYSSTNSRQINISLDLYAGVGLYTSGEDVVGAMHKDANFLKSLEYPNYQLAIARPPATVHLILGSAINMTGVVSDVSIEHLKPLDTQNRAMYLKVSFTVTQTAYNPPGQEDIKNGVSAIISTENPNTMKPQKSSINNNIGRFTQ